MWTLLAAFACGPKLPPAPPPDALRQELAVEGGLAQRVSKEPAQLVVYYAGEHKGSMETCGCPKRPRGSLARLDRYVDASREASDAPGVLLHGGYWLDAATGLDGESRPDLAVLNRWMGRGLKMAEFDAINVGIVDLPALPELDADHGLPLVSANVEGPGIVPWRVVELGAMKVGITGITREDSVAMPPPGYQVRAPTTVGPTLDALASAVDVVVLLNFQAPEVAHRLAEATPAIDVVIDTNRHNDSTKPFVVGHAVWVSSHWQTMRLGELRLQIEEGAVRGAVDRKIDLDDSIPDARDLEQLQEQAREEVDALQKELYGP